MFTKISCFKHKLLTKQNVFPLFSYFKFNNNISFWYSHTWKTLPRIKCINTRISITVLWLLNVWTRECYPGSIQGNIDAILSFFITNYNGLNVWNNNWMIVTKSKVSLVSLVNIQGDISPVSLTWLVCIYNSIQHRQRVKANA